MELNSFVAHLMVNVQTRCVLTESVELHLHLRGLYRVHRPRQQNMQCEFSRIEQTAPHDKLLSHRQQIDSLGDQRLVAATEQWTFLSRYEREHPSQCNRKRTYQHSLLL